MIVAARIEVAVVRIVVVVVGIVVGIAFEQERKVQVVVGNQGNLLLHHHLH